MTNASSFYPDKYTNIKISYPDKPLLQLKRRCIQRSSNLRATSQKMLIMRRWMSSKRKMRASDYIKRESKELAYMEKLHDRYLKVDKAPAVIRDKVSVVRQKSMQKSPFYASSSIFRPQSILDEIFGPVTLKELEVLPTVSFSRPISLIHNQREELPYFELLKQAKVVGIDTEEKPRHFEGQKTQHVALLQLATAEFALIYRLERGQKLPIGLQTILADRSVIKIGHAIHGDLKDLFGTEQLTGVVRSTIDTLPVAVKLGCLRPGLDTLCKVFLGRKICKEAQVSNWEAKQLSPNQIQYAATDAWAPRQILLSILQLLGHNAQDCLKIRDISANETRISSDLTHLLTILNRHGATDEQLQPIEPKTSLETFVKHQQMRLSTVVRKIKHNLAM